MLHFFIYDKRPRIHIYICLGSRGGKVWKYRNFTARFEDRRLEAWFILLLLLLLQEQRKRRGVFISFVYICVCLLHVYKSIGGLVFLSSVVFFSEGQRERAGTMCLIGVTFSPRIMSRGSHLEKKKEKYSG